MNNVTLSALELSEGDSVLEIGFGGGALIGRMLSTYKTVTVTGVDISALAVKSARNRFRHTSRATFDHVTVDTLPANDASHNRVVCVNVIYFWSNVPLALAEAHRVLNHGGMFILCYSEDSPDGVTKFNHQDVEAQLIAAGFESTRSTQHPYSGNGTYYCTVARKAET